MEEETFGFVQLESRRLAFNTPAVSTRDGYQMRVTFQSSAAAYRQYYLESSADVVWGVDNRKGSHTRRIHRLMATMSLPAYMGSSGANYFMLRVRGRAFWDKGGVLSVVQKSNARDFCGDDGTGCDLKGCVPAKGEPADSCTFEVRLPGEAQYQIFLYGISADEEQDAKVSLQWKPPSTCQLYDDGCLDALHPDSCLKLDRDDMMWLPMKPGKFPWINCRTAFAAEVVSIDAELKPFCMDEAGFDGDLRSCWPDPEAPKKDNSGAGCEGVYDATKALSDSVMFGIKSSALGKIKDAAEHHIHAIIDDRDNCRATLDPTNPEVGAKAISAAGGLLGAVLAKDMTTNRIAHLRFEEGPCGSGQSDTFDEIPDKKLRCTSSTYGGAGATDVNALVYTYPTDGMGESETGIVQNKKLELDTSGALFGHPAHSGNFAAQFADNLFVKSRPLVTLSLKRTGIAPQKGQVLTKGTVSMWFKKFGAVSEDGETLVSWAPEDWADEGKASSPNFQSVLLMHTGKLKFSAVESTGKTMINVETFETGQDSGEKKVCFAESVAMPELYNGHWHHFVVVIEGYRRVAGRNGPFSAITFSIDGATATHDIHCRLEQPVREDRRYESAKLGAGKDLFDGLEKSMDLKGTGLEAYYYRDTLKAMKSRQFVLIGGTYDGLDDKIKHPLDGTVDSVTVYDDEALTADRINVLGTDMPCASKFTGDGFAYFPGLTAAHGVESLNLKGLKCKPGKHTVRYRYMVAQGNNKELGVGLGGSTGRVENKEPEGFDRDTVDVWAHSSMALLDVSEAGMTVDVELQSDEIRRRRTRFMSRRAAHRRARAILSTPLSDREELDSASESNATVVMPAREKNGASSLGKTSGPAVGSITINVEAFGAWFGSQGGKASQINPPAPPPPPPFAAHTEMCQDVIDGRLQPKSLSDSRLANFAGHDVSDLKCNRGWKTNDWNAKMWKSVKDGVYLGDESKEDWDVYQVLGKAGDSILATSDILDGGASYGMACGVKYPARISSFSDREWRKPGGTSKAKACVASSGFKGRGGVEGVDIPSKNWDCMFELDVEVHNCMDFTLWMLPKITLQQMRADSVGKLYVKVAYINLETMDDDNVIPACDMTRSDEVMTSKKWKVLCVRSDGALTRDPSYTTWKYGKGVFFGTKHTEYKAKPVFTKLATDEFKDDDDQGDRAVHEMLKSDDRLSYKTSGRSRGGKLHPDGVYEETKAQLKDEDDGDDDDWGRRKLLDNFWLGKDVPVYVNPTEPYIECTDDGGNFYDTERSPILLDKDNAYARETGQANSKSFALWTLGIREKREYKLYHEEVRKLNAMTGRNALPHGILGEFSRCRVWENSQDDTWRDILDEGKPGILFKWTNMYTRTLLQYCQDANHVLQKAPEECCVMGSAGQICYYITSEPGNDVKDGTMNGRRLHGGGDIKESEWHLRHTPKVKGNVYIERSKPCEVGFCTNGRDYVRQSSPPPPPPFETPPQPSAPGVPTMPPMQDQPESPIEPPSPPSPADDTPPSPPSPPPAAPAAPSVVTKHGACSPIDSPDLSDAQISSFRAECDDSDHQLIESFNVEECTFQADKGMAGEACYRGAPTCAGIRDVTKCVVKTNREMTAGTCKKMSSHLIHLAGKKLGALIGEPVHCPENTAMLNWKFEADTRPWYTRRQEPGRYTLSHTCCPALELEICRTKKSACDIKTSSPITALLRVHGPKCSTSLDEVLTGWKLTEEGCKSGYMRWETTCCITPEYYSSDNGMNATEAGDKAQAAVDALESQDEGTVYKAPVQDFRAANEERTGPLLDTIEIQEGASYVPRVYSQPQDTAKAFEAVAMRPEDPNEKAFCKRHEEEFDQHNLASALTECDTGARMGKHHANKFMRVSTTFGTGFSGEWGLRAETHAFQGSLVLEQRGYGVVVSRELETYNSHKGITAATITVNLSPGTYTLSLYAAYDSKSHELAASADIGTRDSLMWRQETTCRQRSWKTITRSSMNVCGGNEIRPDEQPQEGGDALFTERQIEPRHGVDEVIIPVSEDTFDPTKIDGSSLKSANAKPTSSELTAATMADFDGAFLSFKISLASMLSAGKDSAKAAVKDVAMDEGKALVESKMATAELGAFKREFSDDTKITGDNYFIMQERPCCIRKS